MPGGLLRSFAAIVLTLPLAAQSTARVSAVSSSGTGKIVGAVVDSVNGRRLVGADILIESTEVRTTTDSLGRFSVDNLSPGTYQVEVFHPLLDALGITLITQPIHVGADSSSYALLAVPSARTFVRRSCHNQSGPYGESAIVGHVTDPETLDPVPKVEVSISWRKSTCPRKREFNARHSCCATRRTLRADSDSAGCRTPC